MSLERPEISSLPKEDRAGFRTIVDQVTDIKDRLLNLGTVSDEAKSLLADIAAENSILAEMAFARPVDQESFIRHLDLYIGRLQSLIDDDNLPEFIPLMPYRLEMEQRNLDQIFERGLYPRSMSDAEVATAAAENEAILINKIKGAKKEDVRAKLRAYVGELNGLSAEGLPFVSESVQ